MSGNFARRAPRITNEVEATVLRDLIARLEAAVQPLRDQEPESEILAELENDIRGLRTALAEYEIRTRG